MQQQDNPHSIETMIGKNSLTSLKQLQIEKVEIQSKRSETKQNSRRVCSHACMIWPTKEEMKRQEEKI